VEPIIVSNQSHEKRALGQSNKSQKVVMERGMRPGGYIPSSDVDVALIMLARATGASLPDGKRVIAVTLDDNYLQSRGDPGG
jgi:peptidoglycan/xylan/chitin deacetylase (PgdA/CDA1 family)